MTAGRAGGMRRPRRGERGDRSESDTSAEIFAKHSRGPSVLLRRTFGSTAGFIARALAALIALLRSLAGFGG